MNAKYIIVNSSDVVALSAECRAPPGVHVGGETEAVCPECVQQ